MTTREEFLSRMGITRRAKFLRHFRSAQVVLDYQYELLTRSILERPERYLWISFGLPTEVLFAMDLLPVDPDMVSTWLTSLGLAGDMAEIEREIGVSQVCSFHKEGVAMLHRGILPVPRALVMSPMTCDSYVKMANYVQARYGCAYFELDVPQEYSREGVAYVRDQFEEMIGFLAEVTGARLEPGRLRDAIRLSNETVHWWKRALELGIGRSLSRGVEAMLLHMAVLPTLLGHPAGLETAKSYYAERTGCDGQSEAPAAYRLMWIHFAPYYKTFLNAFESTLGASVVVSNMLYPYFGLISEEAEPLASLAERILTFPYLNLRTRRSFFVDLAEKFAVDGVIHFLPLNCRCNLGSTYLIKEALEERGFPVLQLPGDVVDPRGHSDEQMRTRIEAFIELLAARRRA